KSAAFALHSCQFGGYDFAHHELARRLESSIQIYRRQDGFQRIDQQSRLAASSALFFASPQSQVVAKFQLLRYLDQMPFADQVGAKFGKLAFPKLRKPLE